MEAGRQDASLLMVERRGLGSAEECAVICVLLKDVSRPCESP